MDESKECARWRDFRERIWTAAAKLDNGSPAECAFMLGCLYIDAEDYAIEWSANPNSIIPLPKWDRYKEKEGE